MEQLKAPLEAEGFSILEEIENEEGTRGFRFYRINKPFYTDMDELTL